MYFAKMYHNENKVSARINMSIPTISHLMDTIFSFTHTLTMDHKMKKIINLENTKCYIYYIKYQLT